MKSKSVYCHTPNQIPQGEHWAIIEGSSVFIPGDERSRQAPGHGYPAHTEQHITYQAFTDEEEFKEELKQKLKYARPVRGIHVAAQYVGETQIVAKKA